jgi:four helix bundle protein
MNESELKQRTKQFALRVTKLVQALPKSVEGRAIGSQLMRCGTSVGANYRAACRARSKAEFIAKLGVVEEEADESAFWMELIIESGLIERKLVEPLLMLLCQLEHTWDGSERRLSSEAYRNQASGCFRGHAWSRYVAPLLLDRRYKLNLQAVFC